MLSSTTKENAANLRNDVKLTASSLKDDAQEAINKKGVRVASEFAHEAGTKAREYFDTANDQFSELSDKVHDEIKTNPIRSAMTALGVGFVLGALIFR